MRQGDTHPMQKSIQFLFVFLAMFILASAATAADSTFPKRIAPDLVIESAEQGEFLSAPADPRHFKRSDTVGKKCGLFGWRMKVRTTMTQILVQEKGAEKGQPDALPMQCEAKYSYLFAARQIVQGVSPGKYSMMVFVEKIPVKKFTFFVE
jgi:hypothetical protein